MKKRLAILLAAMMLMTCVPVMAAAVPAGAADSSKTVSVQANSGWVKSGSSWMYYVNGKALNTALTQTANCPRASSNSGVPLITQAVIRAARAAARS